MPKHGGRHAVLAFAAASLVAACLVAATAAADSGVALGYPGAYGVIPASTYDAHRVRVGAANLAVERLENGDVRIESEAGTPGGARTLARALLEPDPHGGLRLLSEESHSFDTSGSPLGHLAIDHTRATATCTPPDAEGGSPQTLALPRRDRVVNVPLNLLFAPLFRRQARSVSFQFLLCRGGPHLMDFTAEVADGRVESDGRRVVEVRYRPDLSHLLSFFARPMLPKLSFWFDPTARTPWLAHRLPLYASGPEVFVVRDGVPLDWIAGSD